MTMLADLRTVTVLTAQVVETRGLLARIAVLLNPYDVRELELSLDDGVLRIVVEGNGFDAGRVAARLEKIVGVLEVETVAESGAKHAEIASDIWE
jgi:hypothetical protein